jgi:hypothetical protein
MLKCASVIPFLFILFSCGGGGSSNSSDDNGSSSPNNENNNFEFTKERVVDVVSISTFLAEGPIATIDLLEAEVLWFYHSPQGVNRRDCRGGGQVVFNNLIVNESSLTGTLDFQNCIKNYNDPLILSGTVSVDFSINSKDDFIPREYLVNNALSSFQYSIIASNFFVGVKHDEMEKLNFNISSSVTSNWQSSSNYGTSKFVEEKTRDINVISFSVEVYDEVAGKLKKESIINAAYFQQQEVVDEEETYSLTMSGTYNSQLVNSTWSVKGTLNRSGESYDYDYDKSKAHNKIVDGNFELTLNDQSIVAKINKDSHTEFYLNNELVAQDNSLGYEGDILFIGWDQQMLNTLHNDTPLKLISASPNSQIDSLEQKNEVTLVFNKVLQNGSLSIFDSPINRRLNYTVHNNLISAEFSADEIEGDLIALSYDASSFGTSYVHKIYSEYHYISVGDKHIYKLPQKTHGLFQDENSKEIFGFASTNKSVFKINNTITDITYLELNQHANVYDYCSIGSKLFILNRESNYNLLEFDIVNGFSLVKKNVLPFLGYSPGELACSDDSIVFHGGSTAIKFNIINAATVLFADKEHGEAIGFKRGLVSTIHSDRVYYVQNRGDIGYYDLDKNPNLAITEFLPSEKTQVFYNRPTLQTSFIENIQLNILATFHLILDANSPQVILHEFDNIEELGENEEVKLVDSIRNVIVTTKGIYRATDYQLIKKLPKLKYPNSFLIDLNNELHILMYGGEYVYTTTLN